MKSVSMCVEGIAHERIHPSTRYVIHALFLGARGYAHFRSFLIRIIHSRLIKHYVHGAFMNGPSTQESVIFG